MSETAFDWARAYQRLERAGAALASGAARSPEERARVLAERARAAARAPQGRSWTEELEVIVFALGGEAYAVETGQVLEALWVRGLVRVPGAPSVLTGVVHHRGQLLPVLDLGVLLGLPAAAIAETSRAVAVEAGGLAFALIADALSGVTRASREDVKPAPGRPEKGGARLVRGIVAGAALLDLEALASDPRIRIEEA